MSFEPYIPDSVVFQSEKYIKLETGTKQQKEAIAFQASRNTMKNVKNYMVIPTSSLLTS